MTTGTGRLNGNVKWGAATAALCVIIGGACYKLGMLGTQVAQNTGDIDDLKVCITRIDRLTVAMAAEMGVGTD